MARNKHDAPPVPTLPIEAPSAQIPAAAEPLPPDPGAEPGEPKRRRRRNKPKSPPQPEPVAGAGPEDIARCELALKTTFDIVGKLTAKRYGVAPLSDEESTTLGNVWTAALEPYLPKIGAAVPWATAAVITWTIAKPRVDDYQARNAEASPSHIHEPAPALHVEP
jgi:hypothetical protein